MLRKPIRVDRMRCRLVDGNLNNLSNKESIGISDLWIVPKNIPHANAMLACNARQSIAGPNTVGDHGSGEFPGEYPIMPSMTILRVNQTEVCSILGIHLLPVEGTM